ncbi:MAG: MFS transporter, partial [Clostridia bacterium]|nr:MFS transporter [Clostridia bacterium]
LVPLFIGIIMTFDNIFGVIFQPTFGKLSDNCHSKLGKRRPFIVSCAPISAVLFALIPFVALNTKGDLALPLTMITVILFVFSMSLWRAPVVALMPDLTPPSLRSEGNAVINLMGGLGSAVGMIAGTIAIALCAAFTGLTTAEVKANETISFPYVFIIGSVIMILGMLVLLFFVKEEDTSIKLKLDANQYADEKAKRKAEKEAAKAQKAALKQQNLQRVKERALSLCSAVFSSFSVQRMLLQHSSHFLHKKSFT